LERPCTACPKFLEFFGNQRICGFTETPGPGPTASWFVVAGRVVTMGSTWGQHGVNMGLTAMPLEFLESEKLNDQVAGSKGERLQSPQP